MKTLLLTPAKKGNKVNSFFVLLFGEKKTYCYWCGQKLNDCEKCRGKGVFNNRSCDLCDGTGALCATHDKLWD